MNQTITKKKMEKTKSTKKKFQKTFTEELDGPSSSFKFTNFAPGLLPIEETMNDSLNSFRRRASEDEERHSADNTFMGIQTQFPEGFKETKLPNLERHHLDKDLMTPDLLPFAPDIEFVSPSFAQSDFESILG